MRVKVLGAALMSSVALVLASAPAVAAEFRMSVFLPPKHPIVSGGLQPFIDQVAKDTKGEVSFKLFSGGALLSPKASPEGVRDRIADVGFLIPHYSPGSFPHAQFLSDLSMLNVDPFVAGAAMSELVMLHCDGCQAEYRRMNLVYTGTYSSSTYYPISSRPLNSMSDFKGVKMRTGSNVWDRWATHVGGIPVNMPVDEVFEAMSRQLVSVVFLNPSALNSYSLWSSAKHVLLLPLGAFGNASTFTFNRAVWSGLTPEQRQTIFRNAARANLGIAAAYVETDESTLKIAPGKGVKLTEPTQPMVDDLQNFIERDLEQVAEAATKRGIANAPELVQTYRQLQAKYSELFAPTNRDLDAMTDILVRELYDKVDVSKYGL